MTFTDDQNAAILRLYEASEKRPLTAAEMYREEFGILVSVGTIRKKWKEAGYELRPHGGTYNGLNEREFRELHQRHEGNVLMMMEELGRETPAGIVSRCKELKLPKVNVPKSKKPKVIDFLPGHIV